MSLFQTTWSIQVQKILPPVLRDKTFEAENDDFLVGYADNEYIERALLSSPGHWKEFPLKGVGIIKYLGGPARPLDIERSIRVDLQDDIFPAPYVSAKKFPIITVNAVTVKIEP